MKIAENLTVSFFHTVFVQRQKKPNKKKNHSCKAAAEPHLRKSPIKTANFCYSSSYQLHQRRRRSSPQVCFIKITDFFLFLTSWLNVIDISDRPCEEQTLAETKWLEFPLERQV